MGRPGRTVASVEGPLSSLSEGGFNERLWAPGEDPHRSGNRSSFGTAGSSSIPSPYVVTPTQTQAALFAEKNFGYNGYYMWFANYPAQTANLSGVVVNRFAGPHTLYFEVKADQRTKMEFHRYAGVWLFVLNIDLATGDFNTTPSASTAAQWPNPQPDQMPEIDVTSLGNGWWAVTIEFDFGEMPLEWFEGHPTYTPEEYRARYLGTLQVYFWQVDNTTALWDHVGEVGKGYYLTVPTYTVP